MPHVTTAERIGRKIGIREGRVEGRVEGRLEGRVEEAQLFLIELIDVRLGSVSADHAALVAQIHDLERLHRLQKLLLNNAPISDFDAALNNSAIA